ncbi:hypothetical protein AB2S62_19825 [Vibrio sp. NTOU-M3]|uniref:hypothetical protein n=1 Tax=Vibrio sp. NTOU-M3 TaxID=3234954 RepID=UPI00349F6EA1
MEIFLALIALIVAAMTLFIQRQHNRKQMLPLLNVYFSQKFNEEHKLVEYKVRNDGQGPALLKALYVTNDASEYVKVRHNNELYKFIHEEATDIHGLSTSLPFCIQPNSELTLYSYRVLATGSDGLEKFNIRLVSQSLYEDIVETTNEGFTVTSNPRDAMFEKIFEYMFSLSNKMKARIKNT